MRTIMFALLAAALAACAPATAQPEWSAAALDDLETVAKAAPAEGLPAQTAALAEIARFRREAQTDPAAEAQLDVAAEALFTSLARAFALGGADPRTSDLDWRMTPSAEPDLVGLRLARAGGAAPSTLLRPLLPQAGEYAALRDELARVSAEPAGARDGNGLSREERLSRLRASLERWRWLPREMPERRIEVRLAQFEARLFTPGEAMRTHAVIIGARDTQTPSFESQVQSITLNPSWEPPPSIVAELAPRFRRDPASTAREGFDVMDADGAIIAPDVVDWSARPFRYRLIQRPGPGNALGQLRFNMPNAFAIYLHDTWNRSLFDRSDRALSHGCIRVQDPVELAADVLDTAAWSQARLRDAIATGEQQAVALAEPLAVYLIYMTAAADADGRVAYADDIYHRDAPVIAALDGPDAALVRRQVANAATCAR
jgi:murein L,D-transpeptidase YcbB/YkuD